MKDAVKIVLENDLLERYMLGETDFEENIQVEHLIEKYPEVREEYEMLQDNLEHFIKGYAVTMPEEVKSSIFEALNTVEEDELIPQLHQRTMPWYYAAASVAAVIFAIATVTLWNQNKLLSDQNNSVANQIETLKNDIVLTNSKLENVKSKYAVLNNPETKKYYITGNERAKNLKSVAYFNAKEKLSAINILSLPELPKEKELKMWAEVDGKMVSLGVLEKADRKLMALPFSDNASGYKITIESKGNNDFATIDSEVADIRLIKE